MIASAAVFLGGALLCVAVGNISPPAIVAGFAGLVLVAWGLVESY